MRRGGVAARGRGRRKAWLVVIGVGVVLALVCYFAVRFIRSVSPDECTVHGTDGTTVSLDLANRFRRFEKTETPPSVSLPGARDMSSILDISGFSYKLIFMIIPSTWLARIRRPVLVWSVIPITLRHRCLSISRLLSLSGALLTAPIS